MKAKQITFRLGGKSLSDSDTADALIDAMLLWARELEPKHRRLTTMPTEARLAVAEGLRDIADELERS